MTSRSNGAEGATFGERHADITVGLILSIDRRESGEAALETVSDFSTGFQYLTMLSKSLRQ